MPELVLKRGDTAPAFRACCLDGDQPVDLAQASAARLLMRRRGRTGVTTQAMPLTITSEQGWVTRTWQTGDLAESGVYSIEVEVTWPGNVVQTFPRDGYGTLTITDDLG